MLKRTAPGMQALATAGGGAAPVTTARIRESVFLVTINRPHKRNAVDRKTAAALRSAFEHFEKADHLKVAILTGHGDHFCSGADLQAIAADPELSTQANDVTQLGPMGPTAMTLSKPVIAAIEGFCVAGGLELACWSDLRVASHSAVFGVFCRRRGVPLIDGGTVRLPRLIGHSRAMDLILTGRSVDAKEASDIGLVNRLVPPGSALDASIELATQLAQLPQMCMRSDRRSAIEQWDAPSLHSAMSRELALGKATLTQSDDFLKLSREFVSKSKL